MAGRGGAVELAFGTPGGDQQDQWQLGFLLRLLRMGGGRGTQGADLDLQAAIDGPAWHSTHFPSSFYPRESYPGQLVIEDRFPAGVLAALAARGSRDRPASGAWTLGRMCAVGRDPATGWLGLGPIRAAPRPTRQDGNDATARRSPPASSSTACRTKL